MHPSPVQQSTYPAGTVLTAAGLPRKKPGRKPGTTVKKVVPDASSVDGAPSPGTDAAKVRRSRKSKDPNAAPAQRKRKVAQTEDASGSMDVDSAVMLRPAKITELASMRPSTDPQVFTSHSAPLSALHLHYQQPPPPPPTSQAPQRKSLPRSMASLLNDEPPPMPKIPVISRGQFDPVRGSYLVTPDPYGTGPQMSPRAPSSMPNRASASPSIACLVDPAPATHHTMSPLAPNPYVRHLLRALQLGRLFPTARGLLSLKYSGHWRLPYHLRPARPPNPANPPAKLPASPLPSLKSTIRIKATAVWLDLRSLPCPLSQVMQPRPSQQGLPC